MHVSIWQHFGDKEFDFVICSHLLEDIRDPIAVCSQMIRVGKSGYIEFPSRFRECARTRADDVVAGWDHHRWLIDVENGTLVFTAKMPWAYMFDYLGESRRHYLGNPLCHFKAIHWIGSFDYTERMPKGTLLEAANLFHVYEKFPSDHPDTFHTINNVAHKGRTFEWITEFRLPIENEFSHEQILQRYQRLVDTPKPTSSQWFKSMRKLSSLGRSGAAR